MRLLRRATKMPHLARISNRKTDRPGDGSGGGLCARAMPFGSTRCQETGRIGGVSQKPDPPKAPDHPELPAGGKLQNAFRTFMKLLRLLLVLIVAATLTGRAGASPESQRAAMERLFKVMKLDKQYETSMLAGFEAGLGMSGDTLSKLPPEQKAKMEKGVAKIKARMVEMMGWEVIKDDMAALYMKKFSEAEAVAIAKMLETPTGQMMISKQLELLPEGMKLGQRKAQALMPEIMRIMTEEMK